MIGALQASLRDWGRLLYWVFFTPKALRAHVREIVPERTAGHASFREFLRVCTTHPALRGFLIKALVYTTFTALLLMALALVSVVFGGAFDLLIALANLAISVAVAVAAGVVSGMAAGVASGMAAGMAFGVAAGVAGGLGALRLPFYLFEILPAVLAYRRSSRGGTPVRELQQSPVYFDDLLVLPQPFLATLLLGVVRADLQSGLRCLGEVASNPFQRWAARRALRRLLEHDGVPFFVILDRLLAAPAPYVQSGIGPREDDRAGDRYFTTRLLLGELMDRWPKGDAWIWPNDYLARAMTWPLRKHGPARYAGLGRDLF